MTTSAVTSPTPGAMFDPTKFLAEKTLKSLVRQMLTDAGHDMTKYSKGNAPHTHEAQCAACKSIVTIDVANNEVRLTVITGRGITSDDVQVLRRGIGPSLTCTDSQAAASAPPCEDETAGEDEVAAQNRQAGFVSGSTSARPHRAFLRTPSLLLASAALLTTGLAHAADFSEQTEQRPTSMKDVLLDALREAGGWTYQLRPMPTEHRQEITLFDESHTRQFQQIERDENDAVVAALEFLMNRDASSRTKRHAVSEVSACDVQDRATSLVSQSPPRGARMLSLVTAAHHHKAKPVQFEMTPERRELADARIQEVLQRSLPARKNSLAGKIQSVFGTRNKLLKQAGKNDWRQQPLAPGGDKNCRACHGVAVPCRNHGGRRPVA